MMWPALLSDCAPPFSPHGIPRIAKNIMSVAVALVWWNSNEYSLKQARKGKIAAVAKERWDKVNVRDR